MKKEARIIGFDDAPFDKFRDRDVLVLGSVFRGGDFLEGVLSTRILVDGDDSTSQLIKLLSKTKFRPQLQCILLDGITMAGFNFVDIHALSQNACLPVISVMRKKPHVSKIKKTLLKLGMKEKIRVLERAGRIMKAGGIYVQLSGIALDEAKSILRITCTRSNIPEPIRLTHVIASGIVSGESSGDA